MIDPVTKAPIMGQAIVFQTKANNGVVVTKTFRLFPNTDGLEVDLQFESPDKERSVVYNLLGPHGIPIEGEWYTGTFRDVVFGQVNGHEDRHRTHTRPSDVASAAEDRSRTRLCRWTSPASRTSISPSCRARATPDGEDDRWDSKTIALRAQTRTKDAPQKSDVGVRITSRPIAVGPNRRSSTPTESLPVPRPPRRWSPIEAEGLAELPQEPVDPACAEIGSVRHHADAGIHVPVDRCASLTRRWKDGELRHRDHPADAARARAHVPARPQAGAGRPEDAALQPHLKELQEKYKDDKERLTKETFALYKKHGVNPVGGCLPALIQLPIFVGLWQALNTSFPLRHATFLWIRDLAAPDMLFHVPFEIPIVTSYLGNWFNVLPFVVVGLMLVQTKLFSPPATTPEAEMQQKMMKFMMIFMGLMFYKVPSGLGLYFITSSLWAIGERLLLPKITPSARPRAGGT